MSLRDRRRQTLFIDARKLGTLVDRVHRELGEEDIDKIVGTYHAWRSDEGAWRTAAGKAGHTLPQLDGPAYVDVPGFCKSATTDEIAAHGHVLTPGRYVGAEDVEEDGEPFEEKMAGLVAELSQQLSTSEELERAIKASMARIGYVI